MRRGIINPKEFTEMGLTPLGRGKRKKRGEEEDEQKASPGAKRRRQEPAVSAPASSVHTVYNIPELRTLIVEELITDNFSETMSSLNNFRLTHKYAVLAEQSVRGLPELRKQVATLNEVLDKGVVHYALSALEKSGDQNVYASRYTNLDDEFPVSELDAPGSDTWDCLEAIHKRKDHLSDKETRRLFSVLRARSELYRFPQTFELIPRHEMPRVTADLAKKEDPLISSGWLLRASEHAKDMTSESKRQINDAIRSVRAATWRDVQPWNEEIRDKLRKASGAMLKYPATSAEREAKQGSERITARTERPSDRASATPEVVLPAQAARLDLPSSYHEVMKTLNEQARTRTPRPLDPGPSTAQGAHAASENRPTLLGIYTKLERTLNDPGLNDTSRLSLMESMTADVPNISPRKELERIRDAARRTMDERGAGQSGIAD